MNEKDIIQREQKDIHYLVTEMLQALKKEPYAIFLCGGYGRGEGAWIEDADGNPNPYNDYDFVVITDTPFAQDQYTQLRRELANHIGIEWIDIDCYTPQDLRKMKITIKNVDLVYASKLVYGDAKILSKIPKQEKEKIGEYDILKLYQTRIWTFLGAWQGDFHNLSRNDARFFKNQMAKATLAACDIYLITKKQYTPLYSERVERICNTFKDNITLCEQARWALSEKLRPSSDNMAKEEMENLYFRTKTVFCNAMAEAFSGKAKYFLYPNLTKRYYLLYTDHLLRDCYNRLFRHSAIITKALDVFLAQNYVFMANENTKINEAYLKEASVLLMKWGYIHEPEVNWNLMHNIVADARNHI